MPVYEYVTQKVRGAPFLRRRVTADSIGAAEKELLTRKIPVLSLDKYDPKPWHVRFKESFARPSIPMKVRLAFAQQMAAAQRIEMPIRESLRLCSDATVHKQFKEILSQMTKQVEQGATLYESMRGSGVFDPLALGLVRAGEDSGKLGETFEQLKTVYRRNEVVRKKVLGLMIYPIAVIIIAMIVVFFLMWFTIPKFIGMFQSATMELPLPTQMLIKLSEFTVGYPWAVLLGLFVLVVFLLKIPAMYRAFPALHPLCLKIPLVGNVQRKLIQETFTRTFVSLLKAEIMHLESLQLCKTISTNYIYKGAIARGVLAVSLGNKLIDALSDETDLFGLMLVRSIGFGEDVGRLEEVLDPLAEMLGFEIMEYIEQMKQYIEPIFTALIGLVVLFIMLAMFMPVFSLPRLISGRQE